MNRLEKMILDKGYTIYTFSKRVGISPGTLYDIVRHPRERKNHTSTYFSIAKALGITEAEVRELSGNPLDMQHPIEKAINKQGFTIMEWSIKTGVPYETIIGLISGRVKKPMLGTIYMFSDLLGIDVGEFYKEGA